MENISGIKKKNCFKIVTLESPIDHWGEPFTASLFHSLVNMKMNGYKSKFGGKYNVLPFDSTDFIGVHNIICLEENNDLTPVLAYKSCSLQRCNEYNIPFSALTSVKSSNSLEHILEFEAFIDNCNQENLKVTYDSSFTISPLLKSSIELELEVFSIFIAMGALYKLSSHIDFSIMLANLDFKTDKTFKKLGATPFKGSNNNVLSPIVCPYLGFSNMQIYVWGNAISKKATALSEKYKQLWEERIIVSNRKSMLLAS